jgi:hypothetical protein
MLFSFLKIYLKTIYWRGKSIHVTGIGIKKIKDSKESLININLNKITNKSLNISLIKNDNIENQNE